MDIWSVLHLIIELKLKFKLFYLAWTKIGNPTHYIKLFLDE